MRKERKREREEEEEEERAKEIEIGDKKTYMCSSAVKASLRSCCYIPVNTGIITLITRRMRAAALHFL